MVQRLLTILWLALAVAFASGCNRRPAPAPPPPAAPVPSASTAEVPPFSVKVVGKGPPVLLLPGLASPGAVWDSTVAHLQGRYTLHVFTLAGFGGQPPRPGLTLAAVRQSLLRYIAEQHLDRPAVIGHSLGGFLAYWLAATAPDRVGPVVAVDGLPFLPALFSPDATAASARPQAEQFRALFSAMDHAAYVAGLRQGVGIQATGEANQAQVVAWCSPSDPAFVGNAMAELMTTDLRGPSKDIRSPVLLLGALGGVPQAMQASVRALYDSQVAAIPDHQVLFLENSRHFVMLDDPGSLFSALDAFLARTRR